MEQRQMIKAGKIMHGYYQSPDFFEHAKNIIKQNLSVKKKYIRSFELKYPISQTQQILTIHIRGGDYKIQPQNLLPLHYYQTCLEIIKSLENYSIYIISDDFEYASDFVSKLELGSARVVFSRQSLIDDFLLLKFAKIAIISNSTFAWWAAYLNETAKQIFAPKNWLGYNRKNEYPKGIMNVNFTWV
ncbi:MAG: hypothetical protein HC819_02935 [Cyclobacteriaceae bacterium]|nr:hypothetical protein [Cyclobacteriaceae bacterium]